MIELSIVDVFLGIIYVLFFSVIFTITYLSKRDSDSIYEFLLPGYLFKVIGAVFFLLIYIYYYKGGDTIGYFLSAKALVNLMHKHPDIYLSILGGNTSLENFSYFDATTGYPWYYRDPWSFTVVRITSVFTLLGFKSIMATTILVATVTYSGNWFLYKFLSTHYPSLKKEFALAVLFFPSVAFWGSGILKDSFTLAASLFMFVALFQVLIYKKHILKNLVLILLSFWILIRIKPYIFFMEIGTFTLIFLYIAMQVIRFRFLRIILFPLVISVTFSLAMWIYFNTASVAGGFYASVNDIIETIVIKQRDLTQDYYGGNSFNIGYFEPTIPGILSKFFPATIAGMFRPFLWEARNVVMLMSGLETFLLLLFFLKQAINFLRLLIIKGGKAFKVFYDPLMIYSITYSVLFAYMIGLITANFGALVRYRIPFVPFLLVFLFVLNRKYGLLKKVADR